MIENYIINPIILHKASFYEKKVEYTIIFLLYVDIKIRNQIKKLIKYVNDNPNTTLKKEDLKSIDNKFEEIIVNFYGKTWKQKFGIEYNDILENIKGGGDNFSEDENYIAEDVEFVNDDTNYSKIINDDIVNDPKKDEKYVDDIFYSKREDNVKIDERENIKGGDDDDNIDFESMLTNAEIEKSDNEIKPITLTSIITEKSTISPLKESLDKMNYHGRIIYISFSDDIMVLPEDTLLEFKNKIYLFTGIPIYKQHLSIFYQNKYLPILYQHYLSGIPFIYSLFHVDQFTESKLIFNIPVNLKYVTLHQNIKTVTYDDNKLISTSYKRYGINEFYLVDFDEFYVNNKNNLVNVFKNDSYNMDNIYYGFIYIFFPMIDYRLISHIINNEDIIYKKYPLLELSTKVLKTKYVNERIFNQKKIELLLNTKRVETLEKLIDYSITHSNITVLEYGLDVTKIISLRNLFDSLQLNDVIVMSQCQILYGADNIMLTKLYKNYPHELLVLTKEEIIIYKIIDEATKNTFKLLIYPNGNYIIDVKWKPEDKITYKDVQNLTIKIINPIIQKINDMEEIVFFTNKRLKLLDRHNIKMPTININANFKLALTINDFKEFKKYVNDLIGAEHFLLKIDEDSLMETFLLKGVFQFNEDKIKQIFLNIKNQYMYLIDDVLYQKWLRIKRKTQVRFIHRFSDIKVEILQINDEEFPIFREYLLELFNEIYTYKGSHKVVDSEKIIQRQKKESLKTLKEKDPVLYRWGKYKTNLVYSKICQKKFQPTLLNIDEYEKLSSDKQKHYVKYWNFTTGTPAYYTCDRHPDHKYLKFLIGKHPDGRSCIPCCKKKSIENIQLDDPQKIIYKTCIEDKEWLKKKENKILTKYVITYGKPIKMERLSHIPDILKKLIIDVYIDNMNHKYFLYGINNIFKDLNVGILYIYAFSLGITLIDAIKKIIILIKQKLSNYILILNGEIINYFATHTKFIDALTEIFISNDNLLKFEYSLVPWNDIFVDLIYLYGNIKIFQLIDENNNINFRINNKILDISDIMVSDKYIVTLANMYGIFPIYLLNEDIFFKSNIINKKIFSVQDNIIKNIGTIMETYIDMDSSINKIKKKIRSIKHMYTFINKNRKYTIENYLVNRHNLCYGLVMKIDNKLFCVPITYSHYNIDAIKEKSVVIYSKLSEIDLILQFIKDYNKDNEYTIEIENWIEYNNKIIGFYDNMNLNYFIKNINRDIAMNIKKVNIIKFLYNPIDVNNNILENYNNIISDKRVENIALSFYKNNIFTLLCLEFVNITKNIRNDKRRTLIKDLINKTDLKNYLEYESFEKKLANILDTRDFQLLLLIIKRVLESGEKFHKENILKEFDNTLFNFDDVTINVLKKINNISLITKKLYSMIEKYIDIVDKLDSDKKSSSDYISYSATITNILKSCSSEYNVGSKRFYCNKKKLIIEKSILDKCLNIIAYEILNPYKSDMVFKNVYINNVINEFDFEKRENETIDIKFM